VYRTFCEIQELKELFESMIRHLPKKHYGRHELVTLREAKGPSDDSPITVLVVGAGGYANGVYAIDPLSVVEGLPRHLRKYSKPTRPYGTDLEG
jgi:hypothetical protein